MQFEGWHKGSRSWRNRNPGNLRPYATMQVRDDDDYRMFPSLAEGWQALLDDLKSKFNGSHGLTAEQLKREPTLLDLLNVYAPAGDANNPNAYTQFVCGWAGYCLGQAISPGMTLADYITLFTGGSGVLKS